MEESERKLKIQQRLSYLSRYPELYTDNPQWDRLQYILQISLSNVSVSLNRVYNIGNAALDAKFMNSTQAKNCQNILDMIILENQLTNGEDFTQICDKGFKNPITATYGHISLDRLSKDSDQFFQVMFCKVAVGRTFIFPIKSSTELVPKKEKPDNMNKEFDSLYIYDEGSVLKEFKQDYVIYDTLQNILPVYILHFSIDENRYRQLKEKILCEICEDRIASKYCETQFSYMCSDCNEKHHKTKIGYKHKLTEIADKKKVLGNCKNHPSLQLELFCMQCNRPICINCKIKGDHSMGENLTHLLVRITERYEETRKILRESDSGLEKKKKLLAGSIELVQNKLKDINKKSLEIEEKIYEVAQNALKELQTITKKKMSLLMSDHIQLKRQLDQIQMAEKFIKYEFDVLSPNDLLLAFSRHLNLRREIISNEFTVSNVLPDMRVEGYMRIHTEEESRMKKVTQQNDGMDISNMGKSVVFKQADEKNQNTLRLKVPVENQTEKLGEENFVRSRNNFLNLSILKHL